MDANTANRLAHAVIVLARAMNTIPAGHDEATILNVTVRGLMNGDSEMMEGADIVQRMVAAYYGATDLDLETHARTIIELVARGNRAKRFVLPILDGPGLGHWEMVVKRVRQEEPVIVVPTQEEKKRRW